MNLTKRDEARENIEALFKHVAHRYHDDLRHLLDCADAAYKLSPFKEGDRVRLVKTPHISPYERHGWMGAKHYLVKGSRAVVREVSIYSGSYSYAVSFPDESWISRLVAENGKLHHQPQTRNYAFKGDWLEPWEGEWPSDPEWCDCDSCQHSKKRYERE